MIHSDTSFWQSYTSHDTSVGLVRNHVIITCLCCVFAKNSVRVVPKWIDSFDMLLTFNTIALSRLHIPDIYRNSGAVYHVSHHEKNIVIHTWTGKSLQP